MDEKVLTEGAVPNEHIRRFDLLINVVESSRSDVIADSGRVSLSRRQ
jgi:hypothetical protein